MKKIIKILIIFIILQYIPSFGDDEKVTEQIELFDHNSIMLLIDANTGEIVEANNEAIKFYGYKKENLLNLNINDINILSYNEVVNEMNSAIKEERNHFVFKHKLKDGTVKYVEVYSSPYKKDFLLSIIHDITPKVLAESEARKNRILLNIMFTIAIFLLIVILIVINKLRIKDSIYNRKLQNVINNMQEGFALHKIICDKNNNPVDYIFVECNEAFEKITGLRKENIIGKRVKEILPGIEKEWIEKYGEVALNGLSINFTNFSEDLGKHFNVNVFSPTPKFFATIFTDITEIINSNQKLENERNLLETVIEDALSGYWDWNIEEGTEYYSPAFKAMFGYKSEELNNIKRAWEKIIVNEDIEKVKKCYKDHIESKGKIPYYVELKYKHKNGQIIYVISSGRVIEWSADWKPLRMIGCQINISKMKNLEVKVRDEKVLLQTILNSIDDGVVSIDDFGEVRFINKSAEKLLGYNNIEAIGKDILEIYKIEEKGSNCILELLNAKEKIRKERMNNHKIIKSTGELVTVENRIAPILDENNNCKGKVIVFRDMSEIEKRQEKIEFLSYHDQLTGLYNRYYFNEKVKKIDNKQNLPISLAVIDVNGLKLTNDAFGHIKGDMLLTKVADNLVKGSNKDNIVARIGGDEFIILMPRTTKNEANQIVKKIYKLMEETSFDNIVVSVSIGVDTKEEIDENIKDIYTRAENYMYRNKLVESQSMRKRTIDVILKTLNSVNFKEKLHSESVKNISIKIAKKLNLGDEMIKEIEIAALVHDIGKIAIDKEVLYKKGKLNEAEYSEVKKHTEIGYHILKSVDKYSKLADYALSHHERWDGNGYPRGLKETEIPYIARIISVADAFDSMTSQRTYKEIISKKEAVYEILRCSGTQFDPEIVNAFVKIF